MNLKILQCFFWIKNNHHLLTIPKFKKAIILKSLIFHQLPLTRIEELGTDFSSPTSTQKLRIEKYNSFTLGFDRTNKHYDFLLTVHRCTQTIIISSSISKNTLNLIDRRLPLLNIILAIMSTLIFIRIV